MSYLPWGFPLWKSFIKFRSGLALFGGVTFSGLHFNLSLFPCFALGFCVRSQGPEGLPLGTLWACMSLRISVSFFWPGGTLLIEWYS